MHVSRSTRASTGTWAAFLPMLALLSACSDGDGASPGSLGDGPTGDRRLVSIETAYSDGVMDTVSYAYDADGTPRSFVLERDGSNVSTTTYFLEPNGLLDRLEDDRESDGSIDATTYFRYDGDGRLASRDSGPGVNPLPDSRRTLTFDARGRHAGHVERALSDSGEEREVSANVLVSYPTDSLFVSDRDFPPLGSPDVRVEYMTLPNGEITTSVETYYTDGLTSVTTWVYEDAACDKRWLGGVDTWKCVDSAER